MTSEINFANFPDTSAIYKVVLFENNDQIYLRFGNEPNRDFHEFILGRFAEEIGIKCIQMRGPEGLINALPDNVSYRLIGAGRCRLNLENKSMLFFGTSYDYRIGIDKDYLEKIKLFFPDWNIR